MAILESDSAMDVMRWTLKWNSLMDMNVEPSVEDEQAGQLCVEYLEATKK